jgi:pimeloyl-ACP methyl ester carboxylesterase
MLQKMGACREEFVRTNWGVITRHYLDVNGRRVQYRKAGAGPPLLMVHQSPRSSAEYEPLMLQWAEHFTCIAPDTPGFGQSDPLAGEPEIGDFADSLIAFIDALGLERVGAYGFHSGGIILVSALRRYPERFAALAIGGYAIWTEEERRIFGEHYLPPFQPSPYGEHLTWLWNRILEQSWFFPWFDVRQETRLGGAHADPARVDAMIRDMLDSGDAYRAGYGAVLRAPRDLPDARERTCPVLITAYDGDPLQTHLARLGELPAAWRAEAVRTPAEQQALSFEHLMRDPAPVVDELPECSAAGFVRITEGGFDGLIHWQGDRTSDRLLLHAPGRSLDLVEEPNCIRIDLPGHGLSDGWPEDPPTDPAAWEAVFRAVAAHFGTATIVHEPLPAGDPDRLFPDLSPDRLGNYLTTAWSIVRARHLFGPWYKAAAATAIPFDSAALEPGRLALEHRALLRARAARHWLIARRQTEGGEGDGNSRGHAAARAA